VNPFFFGSSRRQLFGAYDQPPEGGRRAVVLCYPLAMEYLLAHANFRYLARQFAFAGWHVLRFDYFGTGDSAGDFEAADHHQWLADIETAIEELKDISQAPRVGLVGMRYGAALAAIAAGRRRDVEALALWDPVFDGPAYLSELGVSPGTVRVPSAIEADGDVFSDKLLREVLGLTPAMVAPHGLPRTLVLSTSASEGVCQPVHDRLLASGIECTLEHAPDVQVWREQWRLGGVGMAVNAANRIVAWMT
jgi:pimeloyl-ACP methyl ester carboxylesterase